LSNTAHDTLRFDLRHLTGPLDIVGDIHGCLDELLELAGLLGYVADDSAGLRHPRGRTLAFLGDLGDRGPHSDSTFALAMQMVEHGSGLYTPGNHCTKLMRYLLGRNVRRDHGLGDTIRQVEAREIEEPGFRDRLLRFIEGAPMYLWLDGGDLVVAHGGIKEHMIGRGGDDVRSMVLFGDTTGRANPDGTPERLDWAQHYSGATAVVYGHTPVPGPLWRNNTINIDQGCVFGGCLSAVRWPERTTEQVRARRHYYTARTPAFIADTLAPSGTEG
jgi:protein phosphatase